MSGPCIVFSHGQDGEPWGAKIVAMAEVARAHGLSVESVDYRGMDDPAARVRGCWWSAKPCRAAWCSSARASAGTSAWPRPTQVPMRGVFVLAPAFFMPGYEQYTPKPPAGCPVTIVHGWNDTIVPVENSIRYARQYKRRCTCSIRITA